MKTIEAYQIVDHGIDNPQYFQGCGVSCTEYTDCATGIGDTYQEALEDALDFLAQNDWNTETVDTEDDDPSRETVPGYIDALDLHYHVSVRVR